MCIATLNYEDAKKKLPPIYEMVQVNPTPAPKTEAHGTHVYILPYMEQQAIYDQYDFGFPWSNFRNQTVIDSPIPTFICPSAPALQSVVRRLNSLLDHQRRPMLTTESMAGSLPADSI